MLIRRRFEKREDEATINVCGRDYHFTKDDHGFLTCEVEHPDAIERLLSIREGYNEHILDEDGEVVFEEPVIVPAEDPRNPNRDFDNDPTQPPNKDEFIDDDDDVEEDVEEDDDENPDLNNLDADELSTWVLTLPGIDDPDNKDQLAEYALNNYGQELDKRKRPSKLHAALRDLVSGDSE